MIKESEITMQNTIAYWQFFRRILIISILLLFLGCAGTTPLVEYYTLTALTENVEQSLLKSEAGTDLSIGVGPLTFPRTIDRPHIVTRTGIHKLSIAEFHRWGGALDEDFLNVLSDNLATFLRPHQTEPYPWEIYFKPRWQLYINVRRFDGVLGEYALLNVKWRLTNLKTGKTVLVRQSEFKEAVSGADYEAFVAAQSRLLAVFSREIVDAISQIAK
jgi:uncharacterized lipoprotein YmbA